MSSFNGVDLFGAGPHSFSLNGWPRQQVRRSFAGIDGEAVVDMGRRSRVIDQAGRLEASTAGELEALIGQIETYADGQAYCLIDNHGLSCETVILEQFELDGPIHTGRCIWCNYTIRYRQLP